MSAGDRLGGRLGRAVAMGSRAASKGERQRIGSVCCDRLGWAQQLCGRAQQQSWPAWDEAAEGGVRCFGVESVAKKQLLAAEMR